MTIRAKLIALHGRMVAEQRALLVQAAEVGALPPANTLDPPVLLAADQIEPWLTGAAGRETLWLAAESVLRK